MADNDNVNVVSIAGTKEVGHVNGLASRAQFNWPYSITRDPHTGLLYIAEASNHVIRLFNESAATVTTYAGKPLVKGATNGALEDTMFNLPVAIHYHPPTGELFVSDSENGSIRVVSDSIVSNLAPTGSLKSPRGIAVHPTTGEIFVCESFGHAIKVIDPKTGKMSRYAGTGKAGGGNGRSSAAQFNGPVAIAIDPTDLSLVVSEFTGHCIRRIKDGVVTTIAGTRTQGFLDGPASTAQFNQPFGIAVDSAGTLFICDAYNHRIRMLKGGNVSTIAGTSVFGFQDGHPTDQAKFSCPFGICLDESTQSVYVADAGNHCIRKFHCPDMAYTPKPVEAVASAIDLTASLELLGHPTDLERLDPTFVENRCPELKNVRALAANALSRTAMESFVAYLFSDKLNSADTIQIEDWIGLACLAKICDFGRLHINSLTKLHSILIRLSPTELVNTISIILNLNQALQSADLGVRSSALAPALVGISDLCMSHLVCTYHQPQFKQNRPTTQEIHKKFGDHAFEIMESLMNGVANTASPRPPTVPKEREADSEVSLEKAVANMFRKMDTTGDWQVIVKSRPATKALSSNPSPEFPTATVVPAPTLNESGSEKHVVIRCHSVVLYARWPYFKALVDSGLQENNARQLRLSDRIEDGALTPRAFRALLEVMYTNTLSTPTKHTLDLLDTMSIQVNSELYRFTDSPCFADLLDFAGNHSIDIGNCVSYYKFATELNMTELISTSKSVILENFSVVFADPTSRQLISDLPSKVKEDLLFEGLSKLNVELQLARLSIEHLSLGANVASIRGSNKAQKVENFSRIIAKVYRDPLAAVSPFHIDLQAYLETLPTEALNKLLEIVESFIREDLTEVRLEFPPASPIQPYLTAVSPYFFKKYPFPADFPMQHTLACLQLIKHSVSTMR